MSKRLKEKQPEDESDDEDKTPKTRRKSTSSSQSRRQSTRTRLPLLPAPDRNCHSIKGGIPPLGVRAIASSPASISATHQEAVLEQRTFNLLPNIELGSEGESFTWSQNRLATRNTTGSNDSGWRWSTEASIRDKVRLVLTDVMQALNLPPRLRHCL